MALSKDDHKMISHCPPCSCRIATIKTEIYLNSTCFHFESEPIDNNSTEQSVLF